MKPTYIQLIMSSKMIGHKGKLNLELMIQLSPSEQSIYNGTRNKPENAMKEGRKRTKKTSMCMGIMHIEGMKITRIPCCFHYF